MFCIECGGEFADHERFCTNCGSVRTLPPPQPLDASMGWPPERGSATGSQPAPVRTGLGAATSPKVLLFAGLVVLFTVVGVVVAAVVVTRQAEAPVITGSPSSVAPVRNSTVPPPGGPTKQSAGVQDSQPPLTSPAATPVSKPDCLSDGGSLEFRGALDGRIRIQMTLRRSGRSVDGTVTYTKYGVPIPVRGSLDDSGSIELNEYDGKGTHTGRYSGRFVTSCGIEGSWIKPDGSKSLSLALTTTGN